MHRKEQCNPKARADYMHLPRRIRWDTITIDLLGRNRLGTIRVPARSRRHLRKKSAGPRSARTHAGGRTASSNILVFGAVDHEFCPIDLALARGFVGRGPRVGGITSERIFIHHVICAAPPR